MTDSILDKVQIIPGFDLTLTAFIGAMCCVFLGAALYLYALGPSFRWPFQPKRTEIRSLLFFNEIASGTDDVWQEKWAQSPYTIRHTIFNNYISESKLLALKTRTKVQLMSVGNIFFRISIALFLPSIIGIFPLKAKISGIAICSTLLLVFLAYVFGTLTFQSSGDRHIRTIALCTWGLLAGITLISLLGLIFGVF